MKYPLDGLRSDTLAHVLASIGIASMLRGHAKVGWDRAGKTAYIESDSTIEQLNAIAENGLAKLRGDAQALNRKYVRREAKKKTEIGTAKSNRGRKPNPEDPTVEHGLNAMELDEMLETADPSLRELAISMASICSTRAGNVTKKPRCMLMKSLLYRSLAEDLIQIEKMRERLPILDELVCAERMASWIGKIPTAQGATGFDHIGLAINIGIYQSRMDEVKYPHPLVEALSIEGLKALPTKPKSSGNPTNRRMSRPRDAAASSDLEWTFPIWEQPLSYWDIEALLADGRNEYDLGCDLIELRSWMIVKNSNMQIARPNGTIRLARSPKRSR